LGGVHWGHALVAEILSHKGNGFGIRIGLIGNVVFGQKFAQFAEVFDDAVMHNCDAARLMWVRVVDVWHAVGRPTCVADTGFPSQPTIPHIL